MTYKPIRQAESLRVPIRTLEHTIYRWGDPGGRVVFLIHGWADTGLSYQFTAEAMPDDWCLLAPDMRGFGNTQWSQGGYWFPDYLADLDAMINYFSPDNAVSLVGHSMGGNIVTLYAGIFPDSISHLVTLDQYGLKKTDPKEAPERYANWIKQWRKSLEHAYHESMDTTINRLLDLAPGLGEERARFLAPAWSVQNSDGKYVSKIDPAHKRLNPVLYRREEARACWERITAKSLLVLAEESRFNTRFHETGMLEDFRECFKDLQEIILPECGHMLHMEQPEQLATILDQFLRT